MILSSFSPLPIVVAGNRTVILPTKSNVNYHWTNQRLIEVFVFNGTCQGFCRVCFNEMSFFFNIFQCFEL
jgi:hypothetical protein